MDYSTAADFLKANGNAGDCVAFQPVVSWAPSSLHAVAEARPDSIKGLRDIGSSMMRTRSTSCGIPNIQWTRRPSGHRAARPCGSSPTVSVQSYEAILHTANVVWNFEPFHFIDTGTVHTTFSARVRVETATPLHHLQIVQMVPSTRR